MKSWILLCRKLPLVGVSASGFTPVTPHFPANPSYAASSSLKSYIHYRNSCYATHSVSSLSRSRCATLPSEPQIPNDSVAWDAAARSPSMIDISAKKVTTRVAIARGRVAMSMPLVMQLIKRTTPADVDKAEVDDLRRVTRSQTISEGIQDNSTLGKNCELGVSPAKDSEFPSPLRSVTLFSPQKGDVLTVAEVAGVMAAKKTSSIIPLCHPLYISSVSVVCWLSGMLNQGLGDRTNKEGALVCGGHTNNFREKEGVQIVKRADESYGDEEATNKQKDYKARGEELQEGANLRGIEENTFEEKKTALGKEKIVKDFTSSLHTNSTALPHSVAPPKCQLAAEKQIFVEVRAKVKHEGKTGVEMEALTAVAASALTVYDMCKAYDPGMVIEDIRLVEKRGGKSDLKRDSLLAAH